MCGISGFKSTQGNTKQLICSMNSLLHRGPDFQDYFIDKENHIGMSHTRLSVIDLGSNANQPMFDESKRYILIYNGEVYNFQEIKQDLINRGHSFFSFSDSEVVLKAFIEWGEQSFAKLNGMFAFAIYDKKMQILYVVRDRLGIKPLYYYNEDCHFAFASEIKALFPFSFVKKELNKNAVSEFLYYGNNLREKTLFKNIKKLFPGHFIKISKESVEVSPFWSVNQIKESNISFNEAHQQCIYYLERSIERQLISDVPIGVFLSGGIDSSAITAIASQRLSCKLNTYSVGFSFSKNNELPTAKKIAKFFQTNHSELYIDAKNLPQIVETLIDAHDLPFSDCANIPLYLLTKQLRGKEKVILQGDGGDEMFAGYRRYDTLSKIYYIRHICLFALTLGKFLPKNSFSQRLLRYLRAITPKSPGLRMAYLLTMEDPTFPMHLLLKKEYKSLLYNDPFIEYRKCAQHFVEKDIVQKMLFTDSQLILPDIFLEKVDRSTMANGVEIRVPFLDNDLVTFAMSIPSRYKCYQGNSKHVLKKSLRGIVPDYVLDAKKQGFGVPFGNWLKEPLKNFFYENLFYKTTIFDTEYVTKLFLLHCENKRDFGFLLWKILQFNLWYKKFFV